MNDDLISTDRFAVAWALDFGLAGIPKVTILENLEYSPQAPPNADELYLWSGRTSCNNDKPYTSMARHLSHLENDQLSKLRRAADQRSFITSHVVLRKHLSAILDCRPADVAMSKKQNGKPHLCNRRHGPAADKIHFNISHTHGMSVVAIAGCPVGVDVEAVAQSNDFDDLASTVFAPQSVQALKQIPAEHQADLFFRFWTLSEAFIKCTGRGLSQQLDTFAFNSTGAPRLLRAEKQWRPLERWRFGIASTQNP